ncbi:hypothetical protein GP486_000460 [Trichoglossum hirsutum]|uniref:PT repeat family protein n=1 Tax=Trichoglossum hirsutum TaxID=265104 RepID=A0A9P8RTI7_9PEZI|nr:hypothetical protein GP486_000460 [Trichoglossum hirsutum]
MLYTELRPKEAESSKEGEAAQPEYEFYKELDVNEGHWQYKFKIGQEDLWVLDENSATVVDHDGNRVNSLIVQKDSTSQAPEQTFSSEATAMETQTDPSEPPIARTTSHDDTEGPAKPVDLPVKLSEPDIIPPQADVTVLKERDRVVPQDVEDKTNIVLPGHENRGGELVGVNEKGETPNRDTYQALEGVGENSELPENGDGQVKPVEERPLEAVDHAGPEQQAREPSLTPSSKEHKEAVSSTEHEIFPIQPVEETVDEFTEVFNSGDELALMEGSSAAKEPASIEIPNLTEEIPAPHIAAEKVLDEEQQACGEDVGDGNLQEIVESREVDTRPEEPQSGEEERPEETSDSVYSHPPVVEITEDKPTHGGDLGADGNGTQKFSREKQDIDAKSDDILVSSEQESRSSSSTAEALAKNNEHLPATVPNEAPETEDAPETVAASESEENVAVAHTAEVEKAPEVIETTSTEESTATVEAPVVEEAVNVTETIEPGEATEAEKATEQEKDAGLENALEVVGALETEKTTEPEKVEGAGNPGQEEPPAVEEPVEVEKALEVVDVPEIERITEPEEAETAGDPGQAEAPVVEEHAETEETTERETDAGLEEALEAVGALAADGITEPEEAETAEDLPIPEEATETGTAQEIAEALESEEVPEVQEVAVVAEAPKPVETPAVEEVTEPEATQAKSGALEAERVSEVQENGTITEDVKSVEIPVVEEPEATQGTTGVSEAEETQEKQGNVISGDVAGLETAPDTTETPGARDVPEAQETGEIVEASKSVDASVAGETTESEAAPGTPEAVKTDEIAVSEVVEPEAMLGITETPKPEKTTKPEVPETAKIEEIPESDETREAEIHTNLIPKASTEAVENAASPAIEEDTETNANETKVGCDENAAVHRPGMERSMKSYEDLEKPEVKHTATDEELMEDADYSHGSKTLPISATGESQMRNDPHPVEVDAVESLVSVVDKDLEAPTGLAHASESPDVVTENTLETHEEVGTTASAVPDEHNFATEDELKDTASVEHSSSEIGERENSVAVADLKGESPDAMSLGDIAIDSSGVAACAVLPQTETEVSATFPATDVEKDPMDGYPDPGTTVVTANEPSGMPNNTEESAGARKVEEENLAGIPEIVDTATDTITPENEGPGEDPGAVGGAPKIAVAEAEDPVEPPNLTDRSPETEVSKEEVPIKTLNVEVPETVESREGDSSGVPEVAKESSSGAHQDPDTAAIPKVVHGEEAKNESSGETMDEEKSGEVGLTAAVADPAPAPTLHDPSASASVAGTAAPCPTGGSAESPGHLTQEQELVPDLGLGEGKLSSPTTSIANTATEIDKPAKPASGEEHTSQERSNFAAAVGHDYEADSPRLEDAPLFTHERLSPCEERPADPKHHRRASVTVSESLPEPEEPSAADLGDPLLEDFPSDREHILERLRSTESRLEEDETSVEGAPLSPGLSNSNGSQLTDLASARSPPQAERSPNLDAIPEEESPALPEVVSAVPESQDNKITSIAATSASAVLVGIAATAIASQLKRSSDEGTSQDECINNISAKTPSVALDPTQMSSPPEKLETEQSVYPGFDASKTVQDITAPQVSTLPKERAPDLPPTSVSDGQSPSVSKHPKEDEATREPKPEPTGHGATFDESTGESGIATSENANAAVISTVAPTSSTAALAAEVGLELRGATSDATEGSQIEVDRPADAGALPDAVIDKAAVEGELESHVPPESSRNENITQSDAGAVTVAEVSTISHIASTEDTQFTPNGTTLNAPQAALENQVETPIPDQTNTSTTVTEGQISTEGGLDREVSLGQEASADTLSEDADGAIDAKKGANVMAGAVIGAAIFVEGVAPSVKLNAEGKAFDNSQNAAQSTTQEVPEDEPQHTIQHTVAQRQGEVDTGVSASSKTIWVEDGTTQAKPNNLSGSVEDAPGDGLRRRKADTGDRPQTPHSLQSTKAPKHSNIFKTFWRTVFGGWIGGFFTKIFSSKRRRA